jgi:hypothetical protein
LDELDRQKATLESEIENAPKSAPRLLPNLAEIYRKKVSTLQDELCNPDTRSEAIEILRSSGFIR